MANAKRIGYRIDLRPPNDRKQIKTRNRFWRLISFIISSVFLIGTPMIFFGYWGRLFGYEIIGLLVGFCIGGTLEAWLMPNRMFIYNPEWTGYVTQNAFTGTMVPYGPGFHLSFPWEERNKRGNYSLKVITRDFKASIATLTAKLVISGKYEYAINLAKIERAIGIDETTIETGITAFIESFLTSQCAQDTADIVRGRIDDLNAKLAIEFMVEETDDPSTEEDERNLVKLGDNYGFITVSVIIDNITFPDAAQKTRDSIDEATALHEVVARLYGFTPEELKRKTAAGEISTAEYNKMLNRAMAASENAKMDINVVEADIPALVGKAVEQLTKGGKS